MIYIDTGKTVRRYSTDKKTDRAIMTLLDQIEDVVNSETHEGYEVAIIEKGWNNDISKLYQVNVMQDLQMG